MLQTILFPVALLITNATKHGSSIGVWGLSVHGMIEGIHLFENIKKLGLIIQIIVLVNVFG